MSPQVRCPSCSQFVDPQARTCPYCKVELGIAAVMAAQALASLAVIPSEGPLTPEILVPRIGEYLIEKGALTQADLDRALVYSRQLAEEGSPQLVGQVLLELGLVPRETLDQVITEQILQLQIALQQTNQQLEQRVQERTRELQNALNSLAELDKLKLNFVANVSHELRTPLTHMRGYLDLMDDGTLGELSADQRQAVDVMLRSETRLEDLINELIQFSQVSKEQFGLLLEEQELGELVNSVLPEYTAKAQEHGLVLEMEITQQRLPVMVDKEKLCWVITELIGNAIKFTPPGGRVKIMVWQEGLSAFCMVADTGIGIASNRMEEVFAPFHQLDGSVTRHYGGVGLGLALVKKIIEAHGAEINVQSVEGQGSRFEFHIPVLTCSHG